MFHNDFDGLFPRFKRLKVFPTLNYLFIICSSIHYSGQMLKAVVEFLNNEVHVKIGTNEIGKRILIACLDLERK